MPAIRVTLSVDDDYDLGVLGDWDERYSGVFFAGDPHVMIHDLLDYLNYRFPARGVLEV